MSKTALVAAGAFAAGKAKEAKRATENEGSKFTSLKEATLNKPLVWLTIIGLGGYALYKLGSALAKKLTLNNADKDIRLYLFNWSANNNGDLVWKINNTTANTYYYIASSNAAINNTGTGGSGIRLSSSITQAAYTSNMGCLEILNYTSTTAFKPIRGFSLNQQNGPYLESYYGGGAFADNTAVTSIVLDPESTNTFDNGTYALYGIN